MTSNPSETTGSEDFDNSPEAQAELAEMKRLALEEPSMEEQWGDIVTYHQTDPLVMPTTSTLEIHRTEEVSIDDATD